MTFRLVLFSVPLALLASPAQAEMSVATMLAKADALEKKGMLAMMSSDVKLLQSEIQTAGQAYRQRLDADKAAGRPSHSCPPPKGKAKVGSNEILAYMRTIPVAQQASTSVKGAWPGFMKKKFPCPS